jgi:hypothetical protein
MKICWLPNNEPIMPSLLEIALASVKLSFGTPKGFLPLAPPPWVPGSVGLGVIGRPVAAVFTGSQKTRTGVKSKKNYFAAQNRDPTDNYLLPL